jgi:hypothetical protein
MEFNLREKNLNVGEVFSYASTIFKSKFGMILVISVILHLPYVLLNMFLDLNTDLIEIIRHLFTLFFTISITILTVNFINHEAITLKSIFTKTFSKFGATLGTYMLTGFFGLLWSLLFIIPGLIYMINCIFIVPVVVIKNYRWKTAIKYSKATVRGHWAQIIGALFLIGIPHLICQLPASLYPENILFLLLLLITVFVIYPFSYIVITILFINLDSINNIYIQENQETLNQIDLNKNNI